MKDKINKEPVGETLTEEIHKHFCGDYNLIWGDWLNWCMVNYNIIHILKDYVGTPVGGMFLLNTGNFVTKITTTSSICQSGVFKRRSSDHEFKKWKITRIMWGVCRALSGCSIDSCQCLQ
jgi:hypothetical protein